MSANAGALLAGVLNLAGQSSPAMTIYYYQGTMDTAGAAVRAFTSLLAATAKYAAGA